MLTSKQYAIDRILLALVFSIVNAANGDTHAADRPNIVMIISDDQSWTDYGFMGHQAIETPHLDELARNSVVFKRGYVPTALCRPSLVTMLTGHYAHKHGVTGNDPSPKHAEKHSALYKQRCAQLISYLDKFDTLPKLLAEQGYLSHQSGKYWEGNFSRAGFTHGMTRGFPEPGGRHGDDGLKIGRHGMEPIEKFVDLAQAKNQPFFLWYAPFLPHMPHNPPERILAKYQKKDRPISVSKYYAMCDWFDKTCGELIEILDQKGLREDTLIVYVTDNGWIQHHEKSNYALRSKQSPNEGGVRTPILFSWPGKLNPADRAELVSSIDLMPTLLAAAGARQPNDLPGLDLWQSLTEGAPIKRDAILGEGFAHDIEDIEDPEASLLYRWCIEGKWKLLLTYDGEAYRYQKSHPRTIKGPQLYDLEADPHELSNVANGYPEIVEHLSKRISEWYPLKKTKLLSALPGASQ